MVDPRVGPSLSDVRRLPVHAPLRQETWPVAGRLGAERCTVVTAASVVACILIVKGTEDELRRHQLLEKHGFGPEQPKQSFCEAQQTILFSKRGSVDDYSNNG
jgi:hypothetical protein